MMTQEEYMNLMALRRRGLTSAEVADVRLPPCDGVVVGPERRTPPARTVAPTEKMIDERWRRASAS
jgi:hypothetical protein